MKRKSDREALHQSEKNKWNTPPTIVEPARQLMGGIDLDPASSPLANTVVRANRFFTERDDGLSKNWTTPALFLNPPGNKLKNRSQPGLWFQKLVTEYMVGRTAQAFFVGFRLDQLVSLQTGYGPTNPFDYPLVVLGQRVAFLEDQGGVLVPKRGMTHGQYLSFLPPRSGEAEAVGRFVELFGAMGRVVLPGDQSRTPVVLNGHRVCSVASVRGEHAISLPTRVA